MRKTMVILLVGVIFSAMVTASDFDAVTGIYIDMDQRTPFSPDSVLINAFPTPDGATRGLAFDGTNLWSADLGDGNSQNGTKIYKLDPSTGAIINSYASPGSQAFGLAFDGTYLWHTNLGGQTIYKIDPATWTIIDYFTISCGMLFDLTWDGNYLWAAVQDQMIFKIDVSSQIVVDTVFATYTSPNVNPMGLTFIPLGNGQLWAGDGNYGSNYINQWDFNTSTWVNQWPANPASYPNGLAYDSISHTLWVSCWSTDSIYVYDLSYLGIEEEITPNNPASTYSAGYRNNQIEIHFTLPEEQQVTIKLYNLAGSLFSILENKSYPPGNHQFFLSADYLNPGLYFTTFNTSSFFTTTRILVIK